MVWWPKQFGNAGLIVGYLLAVLAAPLLHDHNHHGLGHHEPLSATHVHSHACHSSHKHSRSTNHGHSAEAHSSKPEHSHSGHIPWNDEDCFVCQFLAQQSLSSPQIVLSVVWETFGDVRLPHVIPPILESTSFQLSRAPPQEA